MSNTNIFTVLPIDPSLRLNYSLQKDIHIHMNGLCVFIILIWASALYISSIFWFIGF